MSVSRTASVVATAVALVAVAAPTARAGTDWTTFGFDAQRTGFNPQEKTLGTGNVDKLKEAWTADLGGPSLTEPTVATGVALQGGRDLVYAGTLKGDLLAVDRLTGRQVWRTHLASLKTSCDDFPGGTVGVLDTPTLDRSRHAVYVGGGRRQAARARRGDRCREVGLAGHDRRQQQGRLRLRQPDAPGLQRLRRDRERLRPRPLPRAGGAGQPERRAQGDGPLVFGRRAAASPTAAASGARAGTRATGPPSTPRPATPSPTATRTPASPSGWSGSPRRSRSRPRTSRTSAASTSTSAPRRSSTGTRPASRP